MDSTLAQPYPGTPAAADSAQGQRALTHTTIVMAQSALCVLHTVYGALPAALDIDTYEPHQCAAFYKAWREFDWEACPQVQGPADARDYVLRCTNRDVSQRPQTGEEALQMPFLQSVVQQLIDTQAAATEQWVQAHMELHDLLGIRQQSAWKPTPLPVSNSSSSSSSSIDTGNDISSSSARDSNGSCDCPPTAVRSTSTHSKGCNDTSSNKAANSIVGGRPSAHGSTGGSPARSADTNPDRQGRDVEPQHSSPLGTFKPLAGVCSAVLQGPAGGVRGGVCCSMVTVDSSIKHRGACSPVASSDGASAQASATASTGRRMRSGVAFVKGCGWVCGRLRHAGWLAVGAAPQVMAVGSTLSVAHSCVFVAGAVLACL
jgi:hypothetical protein